MHLLPHTHVVNNLSGKTGIIPLSPMEKPRDFNPLFQPVIA